MGETVKFTCISYGPETWTFEGSYIVFEHETSSRKYNPIYRQLFIKNVQPEYAGTYVCNGQDEDQSYFQDEAVLFVRSKILLVHSKNKLSTIIIILYIKIVHNYRCVC